MKCDESFHIVLVEPEIPPNTGNVARLCAATGSPLHLVGKLGFSLDDRQLKRAGLDYWPAVDLRRWGSWEEFRACIDPGRLWLTSKKARQTYLEASFRPGDFLVFGKETSGLPEDLLESHRQRTLRIPLFSPAVRSLNLATSAGIVLYEALRQAGRLGG